jgi:hypothetical protein
MHQGQRLGELLARIELPTIEQASSGKWRRVRIFRGLSLLVRRRDLESR